MGSGHLELVAGAGTKAQPAHPGLGGQDHSPGDSCSVYTHKKRVHELGSKVVLNGPAQKGDACMEIC